MPIIDKKADVESINAWLSQAKESWRNGMKKRVKASALERQVQTIYARLDQVETTALAVHQQFVPDTKAQVNQLASRIQHHEATLARLAYFLQKVDVTKDEVLTLQSAVSQLESKLETAFMDVRNDSLRSTGIFTTCFQAANNNSTPTATEIRNDSQNVRL